MLLQLLQLCGKHARWILPLGLVGGFTLPMAAEPSSHLIGPGIWLLLFLSVLRLSSSSRLDISLARLLQVKFATLAGLSSTVLIAQLVFPLLVFSVAKISGLPHVWCLAATLVAAASPISGSPNLVALMGGDAVLALRWLIAGTVLLPVTCLPVLLLVIPDQPVMGLLLPSLKLLLLIATATLSAVAVQQLAQRGHRVLSLSALDGAAAITLALIVVGLMSALHAPDTSLHDFLIALGAAVAINVGFQCCGVWASRALKHSAPRTIGTGVIYGNRNIALYLTALPASSTEPLLLFIACYQIPMYLTPLIGDVFYRRLE